jgi:hypothetical protein
MFIYTGDVSCGEHNLGIRLSFVWLRVLVRVREREKGEAL